LVLLGEPGIGKTKTVESIESEQETIPPKIQQEGGKAIFLDLRQFGSETRLIQNLFENPTFVFWAKDKNQLHLFLDSLDECLLRIDTLAALLIDELKKYPVERLYLRITCRTADWPSGLESGLKELWGQEKVGIYELAPLRRVDVIEAAKVNEIDPEAFLQEIDRMEVVPLAFKPITLKFLLNTYLRTNHLPPSQAELYLQGCRLLCEETSESRRAAKRIGNFTADQRLVVAARIAAIIIFANRYAVWTGLNMGDVPEENITIEELCGRTECVNGVEFEVTESAVRETLATGLFTSRGQNRMGWAHQTYAEFLAARYLSEHQMTITQILSLLVHPGDLEKKLVPQLHETAAWLAGMRPNVSRNIMEINPEVLLQSDVTGVDVKEREKLVDALLKLYDEERLFDKVESYKHYKKLNHPGLENQLRPYIVDKNKSFFARRAAINMPEACKLHALQKDLC
jgi:hypothetical protein